MGRRVRWRFWSMRHQGLDSRLRGNDGVVGAVLYAGPGRAVVLGRVVWGGLAVRARAACRNICTTRNLPVSVAVRSIS